jgi:CRISPR-associated protein Csm3
MKLSGKIFIKGQIELLTGLHIGGSSSALDIGGIDSSVIKDAKGVPYIPGSSLKGKMRSLMELKYSEYTQKTGKVDSGMEEDKDSNPVMQKIFGSVAKETEFRTRLIVRDAYLDEEILSQMKGKSGNFEKIELDYTEVKWENTIDRLTSAANPRQLERIPAGAIFDFNLVYNIFDEEDKELLKKVIEALQLVEDDYMGGSGSRGYGQIMFKNISVLYKNAKDYEEFNEAKPIIKGVHSLKELKREIELNRLKFE